MDAGKAFIEAFSKIGIEGTFLTLYFVRNKHD